MRGPLLTSLCVCDVRLSVFDKVLGCLSAAFDVPLKLWLVDERLYIFNFFREAVDV